MATVYAVASAKGGVGKTTTTAAVATILADSGADVVAIDADLGMANLAGAVGVTPGETTLHDVLAGEAEPEAAVREGPSGLRVVPGAADLDAYAVADPSGLGGVVEAFADADYVFIDAGAGLSHDSTLPLAIADETLLVSTPERSALGDTEKTRQLTERLGGTVAGAAITRVTADTDEVVTALLDAPVLARIPEDEAVARAAAANGPLAAVAPDAPATRAYRDLARALTGAEVDGAGLDGPAADAAGGAGADDPGADDAESDDGPTATDDDAVIVDEGPTPTDDADDGDTAEGSERDDAVEKTDEDIIVADPDASGVAEPGDGDDIIVASESEPAGDVADDDTGDVADDDTGEDVGDDTDEDVGDDTDEGTRDAGGEPEASVGNDEPTHEAVGDAASGDEADGPDAGDESMAGGRAAAELEATGLDAATEDESDAIPDADETAREAATERDGPDSEGTAGADSAEGGDIDDELAGSIPFRDDDTGTMNTVLSEEKSEPDGDADEKTTDDASASSADDEEEGGDGGFFSRLLGR
ncbi:cobyrinic acid ac-diamide synthase [Halorubrum coriense DSM 10284]|uniref:Cobyrinic acid ac-diamide synthase n=1 Tax=Halorubrum coriense DSM 10284 TaxID=1227466 RepID=M0ETZ4_9EURY|nr:P-loop NTPase [Halorubrum coriense]ELZ51261.1 cobyrinic acid ac-diamide synthase [Halorubrum coriense DSM 10284]